MARQYQENNQIFKATAQHWAAAYAGSDYKVWGCFEINRFRLYLQHPEFDTMLRQLKEMGIEEGAARVALSSCAWDMQKATEQLFN